MNNQRPLKIILAGLALAFVLVWSSVASRPDDNLHVYFLDVGQGDATLIRTPGGDDILVDGGPDESVLSEIGSVLPFWDRKIELVILTHPDSDHVGGLTPVLERYAVDEVWKTGVNYQSAIYADFLRLIDENQIKFSDVSQGERRIFDERVSLEVLAPLNSLVGKSVKDTNITSLVCRLDFEGKSFLFTGDAPSEVENSLIKQNANLKADVLKVSHHGSRSATSEEFLELVLPQIAVISCGKDNRFNHPHQEVLERLALISAQVYRTDQIGRMEMIVEDTELRIK